MITALTSNRDNVNNNNDNENNSDDNSYNDSYSNNNNNNGESDNNRYSNINIIHCDNHYHFHNDSDISNNTARKQQ